MIRPGEWGIHAVFALLLWGTWGFLQKLATNHIAPKSVFVFAAAGPLLVAAMTLWSLNFRVEMNTQGVALALLAGLAGSLGGLFFVHSLNSGKASLVITLTALYPVVTIILSFVILKEEITLKQGMGIILALLSMVLLSS